MSLKEQVRHDVLNQLHKFDNSVSVQHKIHPEINFDYNSILLVIGKTGSGKTFNVFNEMTALSYVPNDITHIVYVTNNPNDLTFAKIKELITTPITQITYDESCAYLTTLRDYIQAYDEIKEKHLESQITPECREDILENLKLSNFDKRHIYTVVIYDDAMNVFKNPNSKEFKMLFEYRHFRTTYILMMQSMKGVTTEVKAQIGGIWLFGGYNRQQFTYMYNQLSLPMDKEELWNIYRQLPKSCYIYVNYNSDSTNMSLVDAQGQSTPII